MQEVIHAQKVEANTEFCKFIDKNYLKWMSAKPMEEVPVMSHTLLQTHVLPNITKDTCTFFVLIDNLRYDQWKTLQPLFAEYYRVIEEDIVYAILPTTTQYSRNAIFAGMLPKDIEQKFPIAWRNDDEDGGKNLSEPDFFANLLKKEGMLDMKYSYTKVTSHAHGEELVNNIQNLLHNNINIIVYNFVDMLSHARTEMEMLKELASDENAYRSVTQSWFMHSPLFQALKKVADKNIKLIVGTDHGSVRVKTPRKVIGDKQTTTNIRYKHGRNLNYEPKEVIAFKDPNAAGLPKPNMNSSYIFAKEDGYLCYPNNYNHFANFYNNTFQHGGVSLEEMLIPIVKMESK